MIRQIVTGIFIVLAYGLICVLTFAIGWHYYRAPRIRCATDAEFDKFQRMYDAFSYADEVGDYHIVYRKYMSEDFDASNQIGNGPHWSIIDEEREAQERSTWQEGVKEKRWLDSVVFSDNKALVRYRGDMTCIMVCSNGGTLPYYEHWTAQDTWVMVRGHWKLLTSVAVTSYATGGNETLPHSSLMPVWVGV